MRITMREELDDREPDDNEDDVDGNEDRPSPNYRPRQVYDDWRENIDADPWADSMED